MINKKGSLSLSINAIVVIVIAFVVLGLALTLTKLIFSGAEEKLPGVFDLTQLEKEPTSENPITIDDRINVGRSKSLELKIGYYNSDPNSHEDVFFEITNCEASNEAAKAVVSAETIPKLTSTPQTVGPSEAKAYKVIFQEAGLLGGYNYICTIAAKTGEETWEEKQFFLYITS